MLNKIYDEWEFIKTIPKGVKPCFYDKSFVSVNEWFVTFKRRMKGEKGEKGVIYIENLIDSTFKYYKNINDINELKKLKDILTDSIIGINNLVYTYKIDEQLKVSEDYFQFESKISEMITDITNIIRTKNTFFSYTPKLIFDK
jgi:hypothetical protein